ncbi:hypothetical protein [Pyruvatibacter mobilis]|uniref:hypothetical protein n=1 Tax=Pyruvatibacter mobilis TaxID=1712261 RepID=UPI003BAC9E02
MKPFKNCERTDFLEASKEILVVATFSFMPLWLGMVIFSALPTTGALSSFLKEFSSSGDALLTSSALVGPLIYLITKRYGNFPNDFTMHFPAGWFFIILSMIICIISAGLFGFYGTNQNLIDTNSDAMKNWSIIITFLAISNLFFTSVIRNSMDRGAPNIMRSDTQSFLDDWQK